MKPEKLIDVINFEKISIPQPYEPLAKNDTNFVIYGYDNLYPNYLLKLYGECGTHASIIENKVNYIIGDGLKTASGKEVSFQANASDNIKELLSKAIKDYLLFNYFAIEVVYNFAGEPIEFFHVPAHRIRTNKSKTKFWYCEDWFNSKKQIIYDRWSATSTENTSKIFFFDGYFPSTSNVYPRPEYAAAILSIEADVSLKRFNLNNIKHHFSVSSIITFFQGANLTDTAKESVIKSLSDTYTGENGKKMIVDFQNVGGQGADVKNLSSGDWDKAYVEVGKKVIDDILFSHQVTSPMLFGIKTEGQLGGTTELETAFHVFKSTYVRVKRDALESALNQLFSNFPAITEQLVFGDKPLFNLEISETLKEKVYTINELRKEAGLPPMANGDRLLSETPVAPVVDAPAVLEEDVKKKSKKLTEADYELIQHLGAIAEDFEILGEHEGEKALQFDKESDIASYVIENDIKGLTISELKDLLKKDTGLKVSENELQNTLNKLDESGVIKVDISEDGRLKITPSKVGDVPDSDAVFVMYKYVKRPEVSGSDLLPSSRSFCVKLITNDRLYTRADIQEMGSIFGYDIYKFCGGFYYNPDTDETTPHCRHQWKALQVKRKNNTNT